MPVEREKKNVTASHALGERNAVPQISTPEKNKIHVIKI